MSLLDRRPGGASAPDPRKSSLALRRVNQMLEDQSKRIAHAVHDEAGALLSAVLARLEESERELAPACGNCFQEIREMLTQIEQQLGDITHDLRPAALDESGLMPAIELLAERVGKRSGMAIRVSGGIEGDLPHAVETALYRVVQEALNNAVKHARARNVAIRMSGASEIECSIQDDGAGFDIGEITARRGARGLGLLGIRERVALLRGTVAIESAPGRGTKVRLTLPREVAAAAEAEAARGSGKSITVEGERQGWQSA